MNTYTYLSTLLIRRYVCIHTDGQVRGDSTRLGEEEMFAVVPRPHTNDMQGYVCMFICMYVYMCFNDNARLGEEEMFAVVPRPHANDMQGYVCMFICMYV